VLRRTIFLAFAISGALALAVSAGSAPNRAAEDPLLGTWNVAPVAGTPWESGGTVTVRGSTANEVKGLVSDVVNQQPRIQCVGGFQPSDGFPNPTVSAWYVVTFSWPGPTMGGCISNKTFGSIAFFGLPLGFTGFINPVKPDGTIHGCWSANNAGGCKFFDGSKPEPEVTISGLSRKVEIQRGGATWEQANNGYKIKAGDKIHTGWKAGATMTFPDGSTVVVPPMSLILIEAVELEANGQVKRIAIFLQLGEVRVQVHRVAGAAGDFQVKTPTTTASVRGTIFSVLYDRATTIVSVKESVVSVKPRSGKAVDVSAGREVSSTATKVSKPVAIGKAGAPRGSVGPEKALALLNAALAKGFSACKIDADSVALKPIKRGWRATVKIVGAKHGSAIWRIAGKKVKPANKLAKSIVRGCH
jgi:hypothetical protein